MGLKPKILHVSSMLKLLKLTTDRIVCVMTDVYIGIEGQPRRPCCHVVNMPETRISRVAASLHLIWSEL